MISPTRFAIRRTATLLAGLPLLALGGCGPAHTTISPTATKHIATAPTPTPTVPAVVPTSPPPTPVPSVATPTVTPAPTATAVRIVTPAITSVELRPISVNAGATLTATVTTRGPIGRVQIYLTSGPGSSGPATISLVEGSPGTWTASAVAPSVAGVYHFSVGYFSNGRRIVADNDGWNVQVVGPPTAPPAPAAATMPGDIPLVPPFSYLNPVTAVFNAGGATVHGSEVSTNARPDVGAAAVANFYLAHLPRAGWSVQGDGAPPASAPFTIVATKASGSGTRVCVVQYSGGVVHIFYGTE